MVEPIYREIGNAIRGHRKSRGLSLEELAERSGLTPSYVGQVERGERKLSISALGRLARALELHPASLLGSPATANGTGDTAKGVTAIMRGMTEDQRLLFLATLKFIARRLRRQPAT